MNLRERLNSIVLKKESLIEALRSNLVDFISDLQLKTYDKVFDEIIAQLDIKDGIIQDSSKNLRILNSIDKSITEIKKIYFPELVNMLNNGTQSLELLNNGYFKLLNIGTSRFNAAEKFAQNAMRSKIGIDDGKLIKNGWMNNIINDSSVLNGAKDIVLKSVISQTKFPDAIKNVKDFMVGSEEASGAYEKYLKNSLYDIYQQYDAAYSQGIASSLGLKYFIYSGGLVKDSRDFCREHNGHVYSTKDAEKWGEWTPSKSVNISTFKQKNIYEIPSYINFAGYNPLVDRGGYNCRHQISYISKEMAIELGYEENN